MRRQANLSGQGYDISFLITHTHTTELLKHKLVDFLLEFMEEVDKEISEMKLFVCPRLAATADSDDADPMVVERAGQICCRVLPDSCMSRTLPLSEYPKLTMRRQFD